MRVTRAGDTQERFYKEAGFYQCGKGIKDLGKRRASQGLAFGRNTQWSPKENWDNLLSKGALTFILNQKVTSNRKNKGSVTNISQTSGNEFQKNNQLLQLIMVYSSKVDNAPPPQHTHTLSLDTAGPFHWSSCALPVTQWVNPKLGQEPPGLWTEHRGGTYTACVTSQLYTCQPRNIEQVA